jgi:hypothetical protein
MLELVMLSNFGVGERLSASRWRRLMQPINPARDIPLTPAPFQIENSLSDLICAENLKNTRRLTGGKWSGEGVPVRRGIFASHHMLEWQKWQNRLMSCDRHRCSTSVHCPWKSLRALHVTVPPRLEGTMSFRCGNGFLFPPCRFSLYADMRT